MHTLRDPEAHFEYFTELKAHQLLDTTPKITRGSLAKKKIMFLLFLHSKNKASQKGYKGEC